MSRLVATLLVPCAPAWAAPAHRQPMPGSVLSGMDGAPAGRADVAADPNRGTGESDVRSREWTAR